MNIARLIAVICAILGTGCLVAVVSASTPLIAAATVVGALLIALAASEVG